MPGYSYGLPAWECKTGSKLAKIPGTVCFGCYAKRGFYSMYKGVKAAQYKRLKSITGRNGFELWQLKLIHLKL
jgi:hypothetical protein